MVQLRRVMLAIGGYIVAAGATVAEEKPKVLDTMIVSQAVSICVSSIGGLAAAAEMAQKYDFRVEPWEFGLAFQKGDEKNAADSASITLKERDGGAVTSYECEFGWTGIAALPREPLSFLSGAGFSGPVQKSFSKGLTKEAWSRAKMGEVALVEITSVSEDCDPEKLKALPNDEILRSLAQSACARKSVDFSLKAMTVKQ